nr:ribonuclease H-like domain-containing protein [Tanacetum cinerariifolium]
VLQSFVADTEPEQLAYEDLEQIEKLDLEETDLKWKMAMLFVRVHKFKQKARRKIDFDKKESSRFNKKKIKEIGKKEKDSKALITVDTLVEWTNHDSESDGVIAAKEFGMIAGCDSEDAIKEGAAKLYNLITGANSEEANTAGDAVEFALMGVTSEINSSKNLFKLIDSSMSVQTKVGLGFTNCISENELGWDDSAFSIFTTTFEDVEGRPVFHRFAKTDSMKVIPPPLSRDYTSLSDHIDLDESQMSYVTSLQRSTQMTLPPVILVSNLQSTSQMILPPVHQLLIGTHLIKDCDFYEKQMANKIVGIGVGPVYNRNNVNYQNQFVSQAVLLRTRKVYIRPVIPQPVPTSKPKVTPVPTGKPKVTLVPTSTSKPHVSTVVPTGRPNRPFPVPTDRGYSPSENPFSATEDEGIFDSGCSRSMTGNKERLDDFQAFQGGKVTFRGGEGRITRKGTIRTPTLDFENVYYVKELQQFNLFSISQICNKKNQVLFIDTECLVLFKDFKLPDDSMVWVERFMNYLEEQADGEAMINSIKNGDQPLPRVTQVSIAGTTSTEQSPLKDKSMWSAQEKRVQKIDRLARSLLIQGLPNDIYSLIDSNKTAKDLWDALARHMLGELLLDTYIRYLQVINDLKKYGHSKDNCELNFKFLNNLQIEWKQYAT